MNTLNIIEFLKFSSLRITEIMYNPLGGSDYEYIELKNIGNSDINLNGIQFVNGIEYEFGDISLMPDETVVLVSNLDAFASRYGELKYLVDQYEGRLSNGGENLVLQLPDPYPFTMCRLVYKDGWYKKTDGEGFALELIESSTNEVDYNSRDAWSVSDWLGSPHGVVLTESYEMWAEQNNTGAPYDDDDDDGLNNAMEYVLGKSSNDFNQMDEPRYDSDEGQVVWAIETRLIANEYSLILESSDDLNRWDELIMDHVIVSPLIMRSEIRLPKSISRRFLRLRLVEKND